jgi:hypothetical protein
MKIITVVIVLTVFLGLFAGSLVNAQTVPSPLFIRHTLIGYNYNENESMTLDYRLVVENPGETSISNLTLTLVPLFISASEEVELTIAELPAGAQSIVALHLNTPLVLNEEEMIKQPLLWFARYRDEEGAEHDLPVESHLDLFQSEGGGR